MIEEQVEARLERERALMGDPKKEALRWAKRLAEIATKRERYQDQQAAGLMTLEELRERLSRLDRERKTAERELEAATDRKLRIEELQHDLAIVLALYSAYAGTDLALFPPEERRRIYAALGLRARVYRDGRLEIEIAGAPAGSFIPSREDVHELIEHIINKPGKVERRARFEHAASIVNTERKGGVMPWNGSSSLSTTSTRT
ncbi:MAG TPA: hypothetical protein VK869_05440 [Rubrobacteraceae bacterium]|nr:hypothetical protein [Rubrobacteraceae bacterium]